MQVLIGDMFANGDEFKEAFRRAEYRMALAHAVFPEGGRPSGGIYLWDSNWGDDGLLWERDFRQNGDREAWGWTPVGDGTEDAFSKKVSDLSEQLRQYRRW